MSSNDDLKKSVFEKEINALHVVQFVWEEKILLSKLFAVFFICIYSLTFLLTKEYTATLHLLPEYSKESQSGASSLLSQYGGLLGLGANGTYGSSSNALRVDLYPRIVKSTPFLLDVLDTDIKIQKLDTTISVIEYIQLEQSKNWPQLIFNYTLGLPATLLTMILSEDSTASNVEFSRDQIIKNISKREMAMIKNLRDRIIVELDIESGIIFIQCTLPDKVGVSELVQVIYQNLIKYLTDYRTRKLIIDLEYYEDELAAAEEAYSRIQFELLRFIDLNKGGMSTKAKIRLDSLQLQSSIKSNIYKTFADQVEQTKLKIRESTPMFNVLEPSVVPLSKSYPQRSLSAVILSVFMLFLYVCWGIFKEYYFKES